MRAPSYPERQRCRRLRRAASLGTGMLAAGLAATTAAAKGELVVAAALFAVALGYALRARSWARLAERSRIGACSEDKVRHELAALEREGWRVYHSLRWDGPGDIDSVAIAPTGVAFVIETKTCRVDAAQLERLATMTAWLRSRRLWCPEVRGVVCIVRTRRLQKTKAGALMVSGDQLVPALQIAAGTRSRPAFLSLTATSAATRSERPSARR